MRASIVALFAGLLFVGAAALGQTPDQLAQESALRGCTLGDKRKICMHLLAEYWFQTTGLRCEAKWKPGCPPVFKK